MSWIGDAFKTVESVILLRTRIEQLDSELEKTNDKVERILGVVLQVDRRVVRLESLEEARTGTRPLPRIEG